MPRINEQDRRREGFAPEVPITLCDGQEWWLPKPRISLAPRRVGDKFEARIAITAWGDDYYRRLDALELANQRDDNVEVVNAQMDLCCALLLRNYELSDDELAQVLWFDFNDDANAEMRRTILQTAQGFAPKPAGDGSSAT